MTGVLGGRARDSGNVPTTLAPHHPTLDPGHQDGYWVWATWGPTTSYLLATWVLRAGGGDTQPLAGELPCGGHRTGTDITLRVS